MKHTKAQVQKHYDSIADGFTDLSNQYCNSRYKKEIEKHINPNMNILEIGCGTGLMLSTIKAKKRTGCDLSEKLIKQFKHNGVKLIQADAEDMPFKDNQYDLVYNINLLEHVPNPKKAVKEAIRVLKKKGKYIAITPNGDIGWLLEIADKLKLKAPEGPHKFLKTRDMRTLNKDLPVKMIGLRKIVLFPKGPDRLLGKLAELEPKLKFGFFHVLILEKI